jgi:hypothetical protein
VSQRDEQGQHSDRIDDDQEGYEDVAANSSMFVGDLVSNSNAATDEFAHVRRESWPS